MSKAKTSEQSPSRSADRSGVGADGPSDARSDAGADEPSDARSDAGAEHGGEHSEAPHHPSGWEYVKIAGILAAVTALEVFTYFRSVVDWGAALVPSLLVMMVVKFYLVATWFMHLRFDSRLFARLFVTGLVLAVGVYVITLATFEFWV